MSAYATFFFEKEQHYSSPAPNHSKLSSPTSFQSIKDSTINSSIQSNTSTDTTKQHLDEKINNGWYHNPANDLFISILSASVNPMHLIQSFTRRSSTASTKIRQRISHISNTITGFNKPNLSSTTTASSNSHDNATATTISTHPCHDDDDNDDIWGEYSDNIHDDIAHTVHLDAISTQIDKSICSGSVLDTKPHHGPYSSDDSTHDNTTSSNPQEDAIEFNLSIAFNGRKYTATRALQSFVKLRKDLLVEYSKTRSNKKRYSGGHSHVGQPRSTFANEHLLDTKPELTEIQNEEEQEEEDELVIPELPIGSSSNKGQGLEHGAMNMMGMVGNGFRGLQEAVFAYASPMERWIRTVAALAPTSQALANFLWEPIDQMDEKVNSMNLQRVQTLNSIHEGCDDGHDSGSTSGEEDQW